MQDQKPLLQRLKSGDSQAVDEWFRTYKNSLRIHIRGKVSNPKDVEELVQDTFMSCLEHLPLFRGESSIWTWMKRIAGHEVADYYRKKYAKKTLDIIPLASIVLQSEVHDSHTIAKQVATAFDKIRDDYKELLVRKYSEQQSVHEIATALNRTEKSVEADLYRAREAFKAMYQLAAA